MNNLINLNEFKKMKAGNKLYEGAIKKDNVWSTSIRVDVPTSLITTYIKKVQTETGKNVRDFFGDQEIAEEILKYAATKFLTVENLPSSILFGAAEQTPVEVTPDTEAPAADTTPVTTTDEPAPAETTTTTTTTEPVPADTTGNPDETAKNVAPTEI